MLKDKVEKFVSSELPSLRLSKCVLFVFRQDGIPLWESYQSFQDKLDQHWVGALLAGAWQANQELTKILGEEKRSDDNSFRLNFENSANGLVAFKVKLEGLDYYFAVLYKNQINPGKLKGQMKIMALKLEEYIEKEVDSTYKKPDLESKDFLFQNISDEEIDALFNF